MSGSTGQKTEKATLKRRRDAREKGNILKSTDLNTAVILLSIFFVLKVSGRDIIFRNIILLKSYLSGAGTLGMQEMRLNSLTSVGKNFLFDIFKILLPVFCISVLSALVINYLQTGFFFSSKTLEIKLNRLNPFNGIKRMFSARSAAQLMKAVLKIAIISILVYNELLKKIGSFTQLMHQGVYYSAEWIADMMMSLSLRMGLVLFILSIGDYLYQWRQRERDLMMTKQEVKEEFKLLEGNPVIKNRIRQKQRQIGLMRMMQDIPEADVVVTNPTHYAVALRYNRKIDSVPVVVAKGQGYVAMKIKEAAAEHKIEMVENKEVAKALYTFCDVGDEVPEDMYRAIAEILAYVYKLKQQ